MRRERKNPVPEDDYISALHVSPKRAKMFNLSCSGQCDIQSGLVDTQKNELGFPSRTTVEQGRPRQNDGRLRQQTRVAGGENY